MIKHQLKIAVDHRELKSPVIYFLTQRNINLKVINNQLTDYVIDRECGLERKTISDFLISIIDKRIFNQVNDLANNFKLPLIILEGGGLYQNKMKINHNVIRGTILWICGHKRVPLIRTFNQEDTAQFIYLLARQRQLEKPRYFSLKYKKQPKSLWQQQLLILESISGIGPQLAKLLLNRFQSIYNIIHADEKDLRQLPGLGPAKVSYLKNILRHKS